MTATPFHAASTSASLEMTCPARATSSSGCRCDDRDGNRLALAFETTGERVELKRPEGVSYIGRIVPCRVQVQSQNAKCKVPVEK